MDTNDPEPGEIKIIKGTLELLDNCDAITQWSIVSGTGVTISINQPVAYEGIGAVDIYIPAGITAIVKCTKSSGSWDFTTHKYLKAYIKTWRALFSPPSISTAHFHFGESTYNEQSSTHLTFTGAWTEISWDISAIASASKDGATIFAVEIPNPFAYHIHVGIDYVFADPGPSQLKSNDGDRVNIHYPKVMVDTWEGTGAHKTVTLNRKGTPAFIRIIDIDTPSVPLIWLKGMGGACLREDGAATYIGANGGIHNVVDGAFDVHGDYSPNGKTILYMVLFED